MKLNSGHKIILTVLALTILAILIVVLVIVPTAKNIKSTTQETYRIRTYMEQKYQQSLNSRLTKKKLEEIKLGSADFSTYLFQAQDTLKLIQTLENLASSNQIKQKINSSNLDQIKAKNKVKINLSISGEYQNILNYLKNVESIKYFFNIETLRVTPDYDSKGQVTSQANANLTLGIYVN